MTTKVSKKVILAEITRIGDELKKSWPIIHVKARLQPREGEDGFMEIQAPRDLWSEIRSEAASFTADLYDNKGIYIMPEMHDLD